MIVAYCKQSHIKFCIYLVLNLVYNQQQKNTSSPKNSSKEASSYITLNYSIRVHLNYSTSPFYSLVYSA